MLSMQHTITADGLDGGDWNWPEAPSTDNCQSSTEQPQTCSSLSCLVTICSTDAEVSLIHCLSNTWQFFLQHLGNAA